MRVVRVLLLPTIGLLWVEFLMLSARGELAPANTTTQQPWCRATCGNVSIPYPFGIGPDCYRDESFAVWCDDSLDSPKLFFTVNDDRSIELVDLTVEGQARILTPLFRYCLNDTGHLRNYNWTRNANVTINLLNGTISDSNLRNQNWSWLAASPFVLNGTHNMFTAVGCDTIALIYDMEDDNFTRGCFSVCRSSKYVTSGSCAGVGCCQAHIRHGLSSFAYQLRTQLFNNMADFKDSQCSHAFMVEKERYNFSSSDIRADFYEKRKGGFPVLLDWAIRRGNKSCEEARLNRTNYACVSQYSMCCNATDGYGYRCSCSSGYEGNPYLVNGCHDIDECADSVNYPCKGICTNAPGVYSCSCPPGTYSPNATAYSCSKTESAVTTKLGPVYAAVGLGIFLLVTGFLILWRLQKRRFVELKQKCFKQNGGLFLQQQMASQRGTTFRMFTERELAGATNNFHDDQILGQGGHGTVYRGMLEDNRVVAIKKSKMIDERQSKEFARELLILLQINHRNIVKLLGCCLEVEIPMLVYEFVPNGTLFDYIHHRKHIHQASLDIRLRIAAQTAEALAYLHSYASPPILHGDIKPSNILLDEHYMAKVSDFGASTLAPLDTEQFATIVQGTCGYLDPEYLQTCQLTEKSDVYSFGVVIAELLTGKKAICFEGAEKERSLALNFVSAVKENNIRQILETQIVNDENMGQLQEVAELALKCLNLNGEQRPTMKEVAMALEVLRSSERHPWVVFNAEEVQNLLGEPSAYYSSGSTGNHSSHNRGLLNIEGGR